MAFFQQQEEEIDEENETPDLTDGLDPEVEGNAKPRKLTAGALRRKMVAQAAPQAQPIQIQESDAEAVVSEVEATNEVDVQMSEVEKRLYLAQYYNLILKDNLFDDDSEFARTVEEELREFIRGRLAVLLGMTAEKPKAADIFTEEEIQALKIIAAKVLKKPTLLQEQAPAPKQAAPPALKKVVVPPAQPAMRPLIAPPTKTAPARTQSNVIPKRVATAARGKAKSGSRYRTKEDLPQALKEDPSVIVDGGKVYRMIVTDDGKEVRQDITPQARPSKTGPQPLPMASPEQQNMLAAVHGDAAVRAQGSLTSQAIKTALTTTITSAPGAGGE